MTAFYFDKIENFLKKNNEEIVGILSEKQTRTLDLNPKQNESWKLQIELFKQNFRKMHNFNDTAILIEYPLLRLSKRLDTIILFKNLIIVIEFKKSNEFLSSDKKIEEIITQNMYILLIILLCIIFLIYNKINTQIFILIIIGFLYYISELKNKYNYEYFTSKFENTSVKSLKDKLMTLSEFYTENDTPDDTPNDNDNNNDKLTDNSDDESVDDLKKLFSDVDNEIKSLKNISNNN